MKKVLNFFIFFILIICASCTTTKYIERQVPMEITNTEYIQKIKYDSIYIQDSTNTYSRHDTIFVDRWKLRYKTVIQKDTVHLTDSIPYPVTITETVVEKINELKWYQEFLMTVGIFSIIYIVSNFYIKSKK